MSNFQELLASYYTSLTTAVLPVLPGRFVVPAISSPHPRPTSGPPAAACIAGPGQAVGESATAETVHPLLDDGEIQVERPLRIRSCEDLLIGRQVEPGDLVVLNEPEPDV